MLVEASKLVRHIIPPLLPQFHKGQLGRILVLGGQYNGAVFFACDASAKVGADLVHVVCSSEIASTIRGYSPDIMVHPMKPIDESTSDLKSELSRVVMPQITSLLDRVDVVTVGSGLGRSDANFSLAELVIKETRARMLPLVCDADSLLLLARHPEIIKGYTKAIVTPNANEFRKLWDNLAGNEKYAPGTPQAATQLSKLLGGVTVVMKGAQDIIATNDIYAVNDSEGSLRRCGGQGDTLCGAIATFLAWGEKYKSGLWNHEKPVDFSLVNIVAAHGASSVVRNASRIAYSKRHRAMQASDLHEQIGTSFEKLFGE